ncbi:hypothetical protein [Bradyrhizobium sp. S3.2.12]|uniref:hypothetical protein n=1 Tax=Bradyrhizobium sp. S3.2.12 TaxID=3156387 RepID=UPI0033908D12
MITEILAQIRLPSFTAGIVLFDDVVVETAPIVRYMRHWSRDRVRKECEQRGWTVKVIRQRDREDITAPPMPNAQIVQDDESFEIVRQDGSVEFVYFDDNASPRAINGRLSKEAAFARAQGLLVVGDGRRQ